MSAFIASKIKKPRNTCGVFVPETGFEPARRFQRHHLKVVRLPISPPGPVLVRNFNKPCFREGKSIYFIKTILKVVPFPGSEFFTVKLPLWYCSTIRLDKLNPNPQPLFF